MLSAGVLISSQFLADFKEVYNEGGDVFAPQQNLSCPFFKSLQVGAEKPSALGIITPVNMTGNEAGRSINEDESLPKPGNWNPQRPVCNAKQYEVPFSVSGKAIEMSRGNKQAFAQAVHGVTKDAMVRGMDALERQSLGVGTGQLSLVNGAVVASASVVVDNIIPFRRTMIIDIFATVGGAKQVNAVQITSVNVATNTLTLAQAVSCDDNAVIVLSGTLDNAPADGKELTGFRKAADTTVFGNTYEGLSRVTNPEWQGNTVNAGGVPVSQTLLQRALDLAWIRGGGEPKMLVSNRGVRRDFLATETQKSRFVDDKIVSGMSVLKWNDMTWVSNKYVELGEVYFVDQNYFKRYETRDMHLRDDTGETLHVVDGVDAIGGEYRYVGNTASWKPNAHARLFNLQDPLSSGIA